MADDNYSVAQSVFDGLTQRGVRPDVAYGALGSLMGESGNKLNTSSVNSGDGADGSDSLGFGQWNGSRAQNLRATAQAMGLPWNSGQAQVAHLFNELDGKYGKGGDYSSVLKNLQNGQSVADGNSVWTRNYEVPANVDAQVAARLAHGQALAQGAQQGTLDLSKVGGFSNGTQNVPNYRDFQALAPGALSASSIAGNDGALWNMVNQGQQTTWSDRVDNIASILASMGGNSSLASTLKGQHQAQMSQTDKLAKFLQLKAAMQKVNQSQDTQIGQTPDKNGLIMQRPDGTSYVQPIQGIDNYQGDSTANVTNQAITGQAKNVSMLSNNASLINDILAAKNRLVNDPSIAGQLSGTSSIKATLANFMGESNVQSEYQKEIQRLVNTYVYNAQQQLGGRSTDKLRELEANMVSPNGAMNDSNTLASVLDTMLDKTKNNYLSNVSALKSYNTNYGEKAFPFIDPTTSAPGKLDDYVGNNNTKWGSLTDSINKGLPAFHQAHDIRTGKTKPKSFTDQYFPTNQ